VVKADDVGAETFFPRASLVARETVVFVTLKLPKAGIPVHVESFYQPYLFLMFMPPFGLYPINFGFRDFEAVYFTKSILTYCSSFYHNGASLPYLFVHGYQRQIKKKD
jgi:hypothetical protein